MRSNCATCDALLQVTIEGEYAGNCETCVQIYQARDSSQTRQRLEKNASNLVGIGFRAVVVVQVILVICSIGPDSLISRLAVALGTNGEMLSDAINISVLAFAISTLVVGVYRHMKLPQVSTSP